MEQLMTLVYADVEVSVCSWLRLKSLETEGVWNGHFCFLSIFARSSQVGLNSSVKWKIAPFFSSGKIFNKTTCGTWRRAECMSVYEGVWVCMSGSSMPGLSKSWFIYIKKKDCNEDELWAILFFNCPGNLRSAWDACVLLSGPPASLDGDCLRWAML